MVGEIEAGSAHSSLNIQVIEARQHDAGDFHESPSKGRQHSDLYRYSLSAASLIALVTCSSVYAWKADNVETGLSLESVGLESRPTSLQVSIPPGYSTGQMFPVQIAGLGTVSLAVPPGYHSGDKLLFSMARRAGSSADQAPRISAPSRIHAQRSAASVRITTLSATRTAATDSLVPQQEGQQRADAVSSERGALTSTTTYTVTLAKTDQKQVRSTARTALLLIWIHLGSTCCQPVQEWSKDGVRSTDRVP